MIQRGTLDRVTSIDPGSALTAPAATGDSVLHVDSTIDFNPGGGVLRVGTVDADYAATDEAASAIHLTAPLTLDPADDPPEVGDQVLALAADGSRQPDLEAWVVFDAGELPVAFSVSSTLRGFLNEGTPAGTPAQVDHASNRVVGIGNGPLRYTGATTQVDPDTGDQSAGTTDAGDAVFHDVAFTGVIHASPEMVDLDGTSLAEIFGARPRGRVAMLERDFTGAAVTGTSAHVPLYSIDLFLDEDRAIDIVHESTFDSPDTDDLRFTTYCWHTYGAFEAPAVAGPNDELVAFSSRTAPGAAGNDSSSSDPSPRDFAPGFHRFTWTVRTFNSSQTVRAVSKHRVTLTDQGPALEADTGYWADSAATKPADPETAWLEVEALATTWYDGDGRRRGSGDSQYFGRVSDRPAEGNRRSVIWFDKARILDELAGADVNRVELGMHLFDGGRDNSVAIGSHTDTSPNASTYGGVAGANRQRQVVHGWNAGSWRYVPIAFDITGWANPGGIAGFVIGPESNTTARYAAGYRGADHGLGPKLRIRYRK